MKFISKSLSETNKIAKTILEEYKNVNLFILIGPIGAGKTELTKFFAKNLGNKDKIISSSFGIKSVYENLIHYDLFFLKKINSKSFLAMLNEDLEDNLVVIEWGNKISSKFLGPHVKIEMKIINDNSRLIKVK